MADKANQAVLEVAQEQNEPEDSGIVILSTGVRVRLLPVSPGLISDVRVRIKNPDVPKFWNDDKGREEDNPNHPAYLAECARMDEERGMAALKAMCMFGFELVDGLPDDDGWIEMLEIVNPDLSINRDSKVQLEFYYKMFVAIGTQDYVLLAQSQGVTEEGIAQAEQSFQRNTSRNGPARPSNKARGRRRD